MLPDAGRSLCQEKNTAKRSRSSLMGLLNPKVLATTSLSTLSEPLAARHFRRCSLRAACRWPIKGNTSVFRSRAAAGSTRPSPSGRSGEGHLERSGRARKPGDPVSGALRRGGMRHRRDPHVAAWGEADREIPQDGWIEPHPCAKFARAASITLSTAPDLRRARGEAPNVRLVQFDQQGRPSPRAPGKPAPS